MTELTAQRDSLAAPTCRMCGKQTTETGLCQDCRTSLLETHLYHRDRNHATDIVIAVIVFVFTNAVLIAATGGDLLSLGAMMIRLILLGIPFAVVAWKWYRLMHESDPDYGELWHTYWGAQLLVWGGLYLMFLIFGIMAFFAMFLMSLAP